MFADAAREIRFHPGRIVATVLAIAISVAFMAGVSVFMTTSKHSMVNTLSAPLARADVVIDTGEAGKVLAVVSTQPGVAATQRLGSLTLPVSSGTSDQWLQVTNRPDEAFAWSSLTSGRWPTTKTDLVIPQGAAKALAVAVGDTITAQTMGKLTVVGITDDPSGPFGFVAYGSDELLAGSRYGQLLVKAAAGTDPQVLADHLKTVVKGADENAAVSTASATRDKVADSMTAGFDATKYMLWGFAAISVLVGMIIIANTFNILLAQRRRQIGLLRAIGASGAQVRRRFVAEALLLGVIGSVAGIVLGTAVAAAALWWLGQLHWGIAVPPVDLTIAFGVGVIATLIAAIAPSLRAMRVSPMEALQAVPTEARSKRITRTRYLVCGFFALVGVGLSVAGFVVQQNNIVWGLGAGMALTIAVLGGAPIYVPWLLRGLGRLFGFTGPTFRLAAANGARNPQRAAATATALMLAVGLVVTLQVGVATMRSTALNGLEARYPIDVTVSSFGPSIPDEVVAKLKALDDVAAAEPIPGVALSSDSPIVRAIAPGDAMRTVAPNATLPVVDDTVVLMTADEASGVKDGATLTLTGANGTRLTLKVVTSHFAVGGAIVSPANLARLGTPAVTSVWLKLTDPAKVAGTMRAYQQLQLGSEYHVDGSAVQAATIGEIINMLLITMSALLGVAVLVSLVGVANTLGLSVIERKQESALLRALGMQRGKLRLMLLLEALLLAVVATVIGVLAGAFFGWLGSSTAFMMIPRTAGQGLVYSIDPWWTIGLLVIILACAVLASVLPGRRAALATPTEALAAE